MVPVDGNFTLATARQVNSRDRSDSSRDRVVSWERARPRIRRTLQTTNTKDTASVERSGEQADQDWLERSLRDEGLDHRPGQQVRKICD